MEYCQYSGARRPYKALVFCKQDSDASVDFADRERDQHGTICEVAKLLILVPLGESQAHTGMEY